MNGREASEFTIKICGITTAEDGQQAIEAGATALGFNFYPRSPRYLKPLAAREIGRTMRGRYLRVGVFANATRAEMEEAAAMAELEVLQLHGSLPGELPEGFRLWRAVSADALPEPNSRFERYLIDTPSAEMGGSGRTFDWRLASRFGAPFLLAGGLTADNVAEAIRVARPAGVDACSRLETGSGRKNPALVARFIESARAAYLAHENNTVTA